MGIQAAKLFGINVLPKVSGNYGSARVTNPLIQNRGLVASMDALDKTYGQSPDMTGSGIGDKFDSAKWLGLR